MLTGGMAAHALDSESPCISISSIMLFTQLFERK